MLSFDNRSYVSGDKRLFLISGEIHYFRVPREQWQDRLQKFKDSGGNCVATYVPWLLHEPEEGRFTFDGQYDVEAFLNLCHELGLWALVRPGPYQYSELACDGLPGWLCENYPQLLAQDADGKNFRASSVSYAHPLFLEKTKTWYDQVIPRLASHQASRGGTVVAMQFDNELMGIHEWFSGWDYHPDTMGVGREEGRWPRFLQNKYGSISAAATAYGQAAKTWSQLKPARQTSGVFARRRSVKDYQECYFQQVADYAQQLVTWMRDLGADVPMVHNSAAPAMNSYFVETCQRLGPGFLLGSDHYYNLGMNWSQNNPTPQYAINCFVSLEQLRLMGAPPTVFELPGGSSANFPPLTAEDAGACYLANLALGMKGWNYYIFTGGPNPPGAGTTSDIYDYDAAVGPAGELRPLYRVQRHLAEFVNQHAWLAGAQRVADFQVGFDYELMRAGKYTGDATGLLLPPAAALALLRSGLLTSASCAGLSARLADLRSDDLLAGTALPLAVVSWDAMDQAIQQRLANFVQAGGKLLLIGILPTMDADFRPCTILRDLAGCTGQKLWKSAMPRLNAFDVQNVFVNGGLFEFQGVPSDAQIIAQEVRNDPHVIGYRRDLPTGGGASTGTAGGSAGTIVVLGLQWMHAMHEHEAMIRNALVSLGARQQVQSSNPNLWTALRSDGDQSMLFVMNLLSSPMEGEFHYRNPKTAQSIDTGWTSVPAMTVRVYHAGEWIDPLA